VAVARDRSLPRVTDRQDLDTNIQTERGTEAPRDAKRARDGEVPSHFVPTDDCGAGAPERFQAAWRRHQLSFIRRQ